MRSSGTATCFWGGGEGQICKMIWRNYAPSEAIATTWRHVLNRLPTRVNLIRKKVKEMEEDAKCVVCKHEMKIADHLFTDCILVDKI